MKIDIFLDRQLLILYDDSGQRVASYVISSGEKGAGERKGSFQTPRGKHVVRAKLGHDLPLNAVLVGRRPTGEIYSSALAQAHPKRDWILTRILWLSGLEPGVNRLGEVDTMRRYIYIHGTPDGEPMGVPASHGCIRMRNDDIADLFDRVSTGTPVNIHEQSGNFFI